MKDHCTCGQLILEPSTTLRDGIDSYFVEPGRQTVGEDEVP
jgi:hypothetical protein